MDALEWQQLADRVAETLGQEIVTLEAEFWPDPPDGTFRAFWIRVRDVNERVRTAPAIKLDDKLALQHRINELCQRARQAQRALQQRRSAERQEIKEAIALAAETLAEARDVTAIQEVRVELMELRQRITGLDAMTRREDRQQIWEAWQQTNQAAWERLNDTWHANERELTALLDRAEEYVRAGEPRSAKDSIKAFHAAVPVYECSHRAVRTLRGRANELWQAADSVAREKHSAYLANMARRMQYWRADQQRNERERHDLALQIAELETRAERAATDVGAALVRGQLAERRRALATLEAAERDLARQLEAAELVLQDS